MPEKTLTLGEAVDVVSERRKIAVKAMRPLNLGVGYYFPEFVAEHRELFRGSDVYRVDEWEYHPSGGVTLFRRALFPRGAPLKGSVPYVESINLLKGGKSIALVYSARTGEYKPQSSCPIASGYRERLDAPIEKVGLPEKVEVAYAALGGNRLNLVHSARQNV